MQVQRLQLREAQNLLVDLGQVVVTQVKPQQVVSLGHRVAVGQHIGQHFTQTFDVADLVVVQEQRVDLIVDLLLPFLFLLAVVNLPAPDDILGVLQRCEVLLEEIVNLVGVLCSGNDCFKDFLILLLFLLVLQGLELCFFLVLFLVVLLLNGLSATSSWLFLLQGLDVLQLQE